MLGKILVFENHEQAKANNKLLMAQRSEALRVAAQKRKSQIEEVQTQRESILRLQQDRIQAEVLKNKKEQEAAILGLQQLKKQQLEREFLENITVKNFSGLRVEK